MKGGPSRRGLLCDCTTPPINRFAAPVTFEGMCLYKSGDTRCVAQPRLLVLVPAWSWDDLLSLLSSCAGCRQMELLPNMLIINSLRILALRNISTRAGKEVSRSFKFRNSKPFKHCAFSREGSFPALMSTRVANISIST